MTTWEERREEFWTKYFLNLDPDNGVKENAGYADFALVVWEKRFPKPTPSIQEVPKDFCIWTIKTNGETKVWHSSCNGMTAEMYLIPFACPYCGKSIHYGGPK